MISPPPPKTTSLKTSTAISQNQSTLCYCIATTSFQEQPNGADSEAQDPCRGRHRRHHGQHGRCSRRTCSCTGLWRVSGRPSCRHSVPDDTHFRLLLLRLWNYLGFFFG